MANFRTSLEFTTIWVLILMVLGSLFTYGLLSNAHIPEAMAVIFFCFPPAFVVAVAFMGETGVEKSNFKGTVWVLVWLFLAALLVALLAGYFSLIGGQVSKNLFAATGGSLTIFSFMLAFYLLTDVQNQLEASGKVISLVTAWLAILSAVGYFFSTIANGIGVSPLTSTLVSVSKTSMIAFSLVNLSFLWWILTRKPEEDKEKKEQPKKKTKK